MRKSRHRGWCLKGALKDATNNVLNNPKILIKGCQNKNTVSLIDGIKRNQLLGTRSICGVEHHQNIFPRINSSLLHVQSNESANLSPYRQKKRKLSSSKSKKSTSSKKDTSKRKKNPKEKLKPINSQNYYIILKDILEAEEEYSFQRLQNICLNYKVEKDYKQLLYTLVYPHNIAVKYQIQQQRKNKSNIDSTESINPRQILSPQAYNKKFRKSSCNWRSKCIVTQKKTSQNDLFSRFQPEESDRVVGQEQNPRSSSIKTELKENENPIQDQNEEVASLKSMIQQLRIKNNKLESELKKERQIKKNINFTIKRCLQEDENYQIPQV